MLKTNRAISHEKEDNSIVQIKHVNPAIKWTADSTQILKKDQHFKNIHVSDPFQAPNRVLKCDTLQPPHETNSCCENVCKLSKSLALLKVKIEKLKFHIVP